MTQRFTGRLGLGDMQRHIAHPFEVPEGTTRIEIDFRYDPRHPGTPGPAHELSLSLFDPVSGRGARHNNPDHRIVLTDHSASLGYTPGPILPGRWQVTIDTHRILPPGEISYEITVALSDAPQSEAAVNFHPSSTAPRGPGWYRGDLHGHSHHSDARWSPRDFTDYARQRGLDFVTLSDHNTVSGIAEAQSLAGDDLLVMGGMELTTFWGHCLALGTHQWRDWRARDGQSMTDIAVDHMAAGALFVIAHPMSIGHPFCSGCTWRYGDMMPGCAPCVEIWNGDWAGSSNNELGLQLFFNWLNAGHKLVATSGSDVHKPFEAGQRPGYNVVWAEDLAQAAILSAIAAGHLYVSSGPKLVLTAPELGAMMGDVLPARPTVLEIAWQNAAAGMRLRVLGATSGADSLRVLSERLAEGDGVLRFAHRPRPGWDWVAVEIRDAEGALHALANPIFFGQPVAQ